jgi:hypothetical protein
MVDAPKPLAEGLRELQRRVRIIAAALYTTNALRSVELGRLADKMTPLIQQAEAREAVLVAALRWSLENMLWSSAHELYPDEWTCSFCNGFKEHEADCEYMKALETLGQAAKGGRT